MAGWVSLHRKIQSNPIWTSEKFSRGQAWVDLILLANHKAGYIIVHGHQIKIERGQVGWSEMKLSERWKWSRTKVRTFVKLLEKEQQVIQQKSFKTSIITIVNYDKYQNQEQKKTAKEQQENSKKTAKEQQKDTNNNDNNDNNDNNYIVPLKDGTQEKIRKAFIKDLKSTYQKIDIDQEFKNLIMWCNSNPSKRKTSRGLKKFINGWMSRANEKAKPAANDNFDFLNGGK